MFDIAHVILPFADTPPADAIRASLARFQRGGSGDVPDDWLAFHDETDELLEAHEAAFTFTRLESGGLQFEGGGYAYWHLDTAKVLDEMRHLGLHRWPVRFADTMDLDTFAIRFGQPLERHPDTGDYGRWLNPLGRWDWWDLGGRFDGRIIGDSKRGEGRGIAAVSSGESPGRTILANIATVFEDVLGQEVPPLFDVRSDRNVELAATLLADARAGAEHAFPGALVLPPGVPDRLRWLRHWPELGPADGIVALGLAPDAAWAAIVQAAYARFEDHWVAGVAFHL